jgi:hypothetical protein
MDRYESDEAIFDEFLVHGYRDDAYYWVVESLEKKPWSGELKAYLAFSLLILGHEGPALEMAEEALGLNLYNEWGLAVKFACSNDAEVEGNPNFFDFGGFRLNAIWYFRFVCMGFPNAARRHWRFLVRYGPEEDKQALLEDVFGVERQSGLNG